MKKSLLCLFAVLCLTGCASQRINLPAPPGPDKALAAKLNPILHQLDKSGAIVSARIVDLSNHHELYAFRPDVPFTPASNQKLQTGSAALDRLGPDHVFKTFLAMNDDDLWLIGTGDPACGDSKIEAKYSRTTMSMLDDWAAALKAHGITNIKGNLYFYDGAFDSELTEQSWSRSFLTDWYAAPVSGLNFNDNCIDVTANPTNPG